MRRTTLIVLAAAILALVACSKKDETGGTATPPPTTSAKTATVDLAAQNNSGITGTATLTDVAGSTKVVVTLTGAGAGPQPIHIHPGTCAQLNPSPKYPLTEVANGTSVTTVSASLAELQGGKFAINIHKSVTAIQTYVACGNIT